MADLGAIGIATPSGFVLGGGVSGIVKDITDTPCARAVYLLNRPDSVAVAISEVQKTLSNATTGAYYFPVASSQLPGYVATYTVLVFDEGETPGNAQVFDRITPA